ncbi:GDP-4-dehydro-6-deoxy-D-mannose reductase [Paenibacillus forsythiae]|uniref:GDP-4-dehydro-6-deoxy-D-mannose reductase n=1 Tax=Paenibacillus forsythiae TaxID=365616 RepID=A0ABU3HB94_9BACL|nr:GDP-mannose 4,6-dehydratase [Paenibacillus forsythiae]MDT3428098.1 GDP-4-dehydro-6-deoxy-D-mannose reductase [Paenibacillus forsythiae]
MKALITGVTGFVGQHLASYLLMNGYYVLGTSRHNANNEQFIEGIELVNIDFDNTADIVKVLDTVQPDFIYHLAGQSSVKDSWVDKEGTFQSNVNLTLRLLEAVVSSSVKDTVKILTVGSSEEYGGIDANSEPIPESTQLKPTSPYGISKATVGMLVRHYYMAYGLKVVHVRPFNHIGPGQRMGFVVSDFSNQIVEIERGDRDRVISVGNLSAQRDFTDVRDIVRAYYLLLSQEVEMCWGESVNVCSGEATPVQSILDILLSLCSVSIEVKVDQNKFRPIDVPLFIGDNTKLKSLTDWEPLYNLEQTLNDVIENLRNQS